MPRKPGEYCRERKHDGDGSKSGVEARANQIEAAGNAGKGVHGHTPAITERRHPSSASRARL